MTQVIYKNSYEDCIQKAQEIYSYYYENWVNCEDYEREEAIQQRKTAEELVRLANACTSSYELMQECNQRSIEECNNGYGCNSYIWDEMAKFCYS